MSFIEPKKLLNFRDHSGYDSLSREWFLKVIFFLLSLFSILNSLKRKLQRTKKLTSSALMVAYFSASQIENSCLLQLLKVGQLSPKSCLNEDKWVLIAYKLVVYIKKCSFEPRIYVSYFFIQLTWWTSWKCNILLTPYLSS